MAGLYGKPQRKSAEEKVKDRGGLCKKVGRVEVCDTPTGEPDSFVKEGQYTAPHQESGQRAGESATAWNQRRRRLEKEKKERERLRNK